MKNIAYIPNSHLDLYWLGSYQTCLERGNEILKTFLDRCIEYDETFLIETVVFLEHFLKTYPNYRKIIKKLYANQQVDIGAAYVDRWEGLIQGESLIRNIVIGKQKLKELLDINSPLAVHPDLPSMSSQISQIYSQSSVKYYFTTRKIYPMGSIWKLKSPDNSTMFVLNMPLHYMFYGLDPESDQQYNYRTEAHAQFHIADLSEGFPAGTVLLAGGAGDLASPDTFRERYELSLQDYIKKYQKVFPEYHWGYSTPRRILAEYVDEQYPVPVHSGEIPSVWGVACDETVEYFQNDRLWERVLLIAEELVCQAQYHTRPWLPDGFTDWQGKFYESAFYKSNDNFQNPEEVLAKLWEMKVFTQDHNGGGYEGALSTFQKRVMQERGIDYTTQIIQKVLAPKQDEIAIYNPSNYAYAGHVILSKKWKDKAIPVAYPKHLKVQEDSNQVYMEIDSLAPFRSQYFPTSENATVESSSNLKIVPFENENCWLLKDQENSVYISCQTGNIYAWETVLLHDSANNIGELEVESELHSDVTLRRDPDTPVHKEEFIGLRTYEDGAIFQRITVRKILLDCIVEQSYTLFRRTGELELRCKIHWSGIHYKQLRIKLADYTNRNTISYGTPFFANSYADCIANAEPRNIDELLLEDFQAYREIQGWVALPQKQNWLSILSDNPGIYAHDGTLSAVLIRTAPSCGDHRFFWENAGVLDFSFRYFPARLQADEQNKQYSMLLAHRFLHYAPVAICGGGNPYPAQAARPSPQELELEPAGTATQMLTRYELSEQLQIESLENTVLISALYPAAESGVFVLRILNASFSNSLATLRGELIMGKKLYRCNFLEERADQVQNSIELNPWEIRTILICT